MTDTKQTSDERRERVQRRMRIDKLTHSTVATLPDEAPTSGGVLVDAERYGVKTGEAQHFAVVKVNEEPRRPTEAELDDALDWNRKLLRQAGQLLFAAPEAKCSECKHVNFEDASGYTCLLKRKPQPVSADNVCARWTCEVCGHRGYTSRGRALINHREDWWPFDGYTERDYRRCTHCAAQAAVAVVDALDHEMRCDRQGATRIIDSRD